MSLSHGPWSLCLDGVSPLSHPYAFLFLSRLILLQTHAACLGLYDMESSIKLLFPEFKITYSPDFRNDIALSWPSVIDDSFARNDWGWEHNFDLKKTTLEMVNGIKN